MSFGPLPVPDPPRRGQPVQAAWGDAVIAALRALDARTRSLLATGGPGINVSHSAGGQTICLKSGGRPGTDHPFKVRYDSATGNVVVGHGLIGGFPVTPHAEQTFAPAAGISSIGVCISDWPHGWDIHPFWCSLNSAMSSATKVADGWSGVTGDEFYYDLAVWPTDKVSIFVVPVATISTAAGGAVTVLTQFLRTDILYWPPSEMISGAANNELELESSSDFRLKVILPP